MVRTQGQDNGDAGILLANIGGIELRQDNFEAAKQLFEQALPLVSRHHGENDPRTAGLIGNLALAYLNLGDNERARDLQLRGLELSRRSLGPEHPNVGIDRLTLGRTAESIGDDHEALEQIEHAVQIFHNSLGPGHPLSLAAQKTQAGLFLRSGRLDDARLTLQLGLEHARDESATRSAQLVNRLVLAEVERLSSRLQEALVLSDSVLGDPLATTDPRIMEDALWCRAYVLAQQGDRAGGDKARSRALGIRNSGARAGLPAGMLAEARYFAVAGNPQHAFGLLRQAVEGGLASATVLSDPAFEEVRKLPGFSDIATALGRD